MPFIGNQPALAYTSFAVQHFTTSATTSYTLDYPVANENEIRLVINNVVQQPGSSYAYTASGTSLTLSAATTGTDTMYVVFLGKAVQTVNPPNGSVGLSQLSATGTKDSTTFLRGDNTFAVPAGGTNIPNFSAKRSGNGNSLTADTATAVVLDSEQFDTDNAYSTSTGKFIVPSGKAGKYFFTGSVTMATSFVYGLAFLYKNGSEVYRGTAVQNDTSTATVSAIIDCSVGDEIQLYATSSSTQNVTSACYFQGFKLIT